jgi:hypothetical protein
VGKCFRQNEAKKLNRFKVNQPGLSAFAVNRKLLQQAVAGGCDRHQKKG